LPVVKSARQQEQISGETPIVIKSEGESSEQASKDGQDDATDRQRMIVAIQAYQPKSQYGGYGYTEERAFKGPTVGEDEDSDAKQESVARSLTAALQTRESAENQRCADSGDGASPVAVHPIAENGKAHHDQRSAKKRPARREPSLQHPENGGDHGGGGEQHADPRSERWAIGGIDEQLAERQNGGLRRRVHGRIGGVKVDLESFEEEGHWMGRKGEASVSEDVRLKKIAVLIMDGGARIRNDRLQEQADQNCGEKQDK